MFTYIRCVDVARKYRAISIIQRLTFVFCIDQLVWLISMLNQQLYDFNACCVAQKRQSVVTDVCALLKSPAKTMVLAQGPTSLIPQIQQSTTSFMQHGF